MDSSAKVTYRANFALECYKKCVDLDFSSIKKDADQYRGIILTGWSRFDHFAVLCELFSVGVPSLAVDLQLVKNGGQLQKSYAEAKKILNCDSLNEPKFKELDLLTKSFVPVGQPIPLAATLPLGTVQCTYPGKTMQKPKFAIKGLRNS